MHAKAGTGKSLQTYAFIKAHRKRFDVPGPRNSSERLLRLAARAGLSAGFRGRQASRVDPCLARIERQYGKARRIR